MRMSKLFLALSVVSLGALAQPIRRISRRLQLRGPGPRGWRGWTMFLPAASSWAMVGGPRLGRASE